MVQKAWAKNEVSVKYAGPVQIKRALVVRGTSARATVIGTTTGRYMVHTIFMPEL
jgi:hypothetical protein